MANYYTGNAKSRRHFEDLGTDAIPEGLVYSGSVLGGGGYTVRVVGVVATSAAVARIGIAKIF